ncbi:MAG: DUF1492 domain-containing protein [Oscillospiraceae bacterium]|nr:DUF1492 domain-containing protein [Oscillospiraceae bacterium]
MTAKEWLLRARNIDAEIRELRKGRERALTEATSAAVNADGERVQTSNGNTTEKKFINYAAYSEAIDKRIDELYAVKREILTVISEVDDAALRTLLIAKYINGKTWEKIAENMCYSEYHVKRRLHSQALRAVEEILRKRKEQF